MPLYEYRCHSCGKTLEVLQKFSDDPLKVHEDCGGELERLISRSALQFKGSGWYVTDYAKGGSAGNAAANGSADSKAADSKAPETKASGNGSAGSESKSASTESASKPAAAPASTDSK